MKKALSVLLAMGLVVGLVACGPKNKDTKTNNKVKTATPTTTVAKPASTTVAEKKDAPKAGESKTEPKKDVDKGGDQPIVTVTTSFLRDMVQQIAGKSVKINTIIPAGEDPHLYVAKPEDLTKLKEAKLVLYHGLHFEGKMVDILEGNHGVKVSEKFPKDKIGKMEEDGKTITDPHFWFDISLYKLATQRAAEALETLVPAKKDEYQKNAEAYLKKLDELDKWNKEQFAKIPEGSRYLVTPHDAFNYFSRYYNIKVVAPQGVSTDGEVSAADIEKTAKFIAEHKIKAIFAESTTDPARMETLKKAAAKLGQEVKVVKGEGQELFSDSLAQEGKDGDTYIAMYKHNTQLMVDNLK